MERRAFFKTAGVTALAFTALPKLARGATGDGLVVRSTISRNHGHVLSLTLSQVVERLRETAGGTPTSVDIQGTSSHPHTLELTHDFLLDLLIEGSGLTLSSQVFGHAHEVEIVIAPPSP